MPVAEKPAAKLTGVVLPPVCTVRLEVVEWVRALLVPVMVSVEVAAGVALPVVTVMVEVPLVVTVGGEKLAPAPLGKPVAPSVTVPVKPFWGLTVIV
jgi:hypothetical protein